MERNDAGDFLPCHIDNRGVSQCFADRTSLRVFDRRVGHHPSDRPAVTVQNAALRGRHADGFVFGFGNRDVIGIHARQNFSVFIDNFARAVQNADHSAVNADSGSRIQHTPQNDILVIQHIAVCRQTPDKFAFGGHHLSVDVGKAQIGASRRKPDVTAGNRAADGSVFAQKGFIRQDAPFEFAVVNDGTVGHHAAFKTAARSDNRSVRPQSAYHLLAVIDNRRVGQQAPQQVAFEADGLAVGINFADCLSVPSQNRAFLHIAANGIVAHVNHNHRRGQPSDLLVGRHDRPVRADTADKAAPRTDGKPFFNHAADDVAVFVNHESVG